MNTPSNDNAWPRLISFILPRALVPQPRAGAAVAASHAMATIPLLRSTTANTTTNNNMRDRDNRHQHNTGQQQQQHQ